MATLPSREKRFLSIGIPLIEIEVEIEIVIDGPPTHEPPAGRGLHDFDFDFDYEPTSTAYTPAAVETTTLRATTASPFARATVAGRWKPTTSPELGMNESQPSSVTTNRPFSVTSGVIPAAPRACTLPIASPARLKRKSVPSVPVTHTMP